MAKNERGQKYIISLFQKISSGEKMKIVEREFAKMRESNKDATSCSLQKEKHPIGKPRIQHNVRISSDHEIKKKDHERKRPSKHMKKRRALVSTSSLAPNTSYSEEVWKQ